MPLYMAGRNTGHGHTDDQRIWWSRSYDGNNWNGMNEVPGANSWTVLPHRCVGIPTFVGHPGFMNATLMVTYVKPGGGGLFGSSTDRGHTWGPEFRVTNYRGPATP